MSLLFNQRIKELDAAFSKAAVSSRTARGWSVSELARRAGVGRITVTRMERRACAVSIGAVLRVLDRLGLDVVISIRPKGDHNV